VATTTLPKFDWPIGMTMEQVRQHAQDTMEFVQRDLDKAGDVDDANYYEGYVNALKDLLTTITFPRHEDDARECVHAHLVWIGNECGECEKTGYAWAEKS
jgi:hypothetical protein